ncbi:HK97-gp10 family putative phage morphogenesis protein [Sphingosinicella sp. BN140058]|uniref:HK97-gp10 family putative phage morphogenesis protein n=1 Tax=Sphingosinicella sp. BN140058 TaxID=1892855 RepID=UPI00101177BD|nr:HK97-gp10 family putative phage morphogenesis protein [Sphingosinicella sp. BN140058]QAY77921.1 hypothetical protein ETR14_16375 [Sphingosinicella sp. BN140058]
MARRRGGGARIEGVRECSAALSSLSKGVARGVGRRALQVPADMLVTAVKKNAAAIRFTGALEESIEKRPERARRGRPQVQVRANDIAAIQDEFGNSRMAAQPFFRPAVESEKGVMFEAFAAALKDETDKAVARAAKRAAKKAQG